MTHAVGLVVGSLLAALFGAPAAQVNSLNRHALHGPGRYAVTATADDGVIECIESAATPFCIRLQWYPECQLGEVDGNVIRAFVAAAWQWQASRPICP